MKLSQALVQLTLTSTSPDQLELKTAHARGNYKIESWQAGIEASISCKIEKLKISLAYSKKKV